ncbi:MAG: cell division topological specificity factor MinE [Candidatus Competibacteraceae bacterium]|nr:cell division topological specificity factor MinE [Candidatus Competibacteraceae bacterium]
MSFIDLFRGLKGDTGTASTAKERLQIIIAHERAESSQQPASPSYLPAMKEDILAVVRKYVDIDPDQIQLTVEREGNCEVLEVNITLPEEAGAAV